jgi:hypothetical protein
VAAKITVYLSTPADEFIVHKSIQLNQYKNDILIHGFCDATEAYGCSPDVSNKSSAFLFML